MKPDLPDSNPLRPRRRWHQVTWGDHQHWEFRVGGVTVYRWCKGNVCHLPGNTGHRVGVQLARRKYSGRRNG